MVQEIEDDEIEVRKWGGKKYVELLKDEKANNNQNGVHLLANLLYGSEGD